jgi:hypothetical protein
MAVLWKAGKTNGRFSPLSTAPWESSQPRRIPTFPQPRLLLPLIQSEKKKTERKSAAARPPLPDRFQDHLVLETFLISGSSDDWKMLDCRKRRRRKNYREGALGRVGGLSACFELETAPSGTN